MFGDGALSGREIAARLIKGSGQPYVIYYRLNGDGDAVEIEVVELRSASLDEVQGVPLDADYLQLSNSDIVYYIGGRLFAAEEVAGIDDPTEPDLVQQFTASKGKALLRIRSGMHYMCLSLECVHIPLTAEGELDLANVTRHSGGDATSVAREG